MMLPLNPGWCFATVVHQIEGAVGEDERGPSIWDTFSHLEPSRTNGDNGDIACDRYHQYHEDLDLLAKYGAKAYRFSLSWSRIIPLGGRDDLVNEAGIAFHNKLIDGLPFRGINPWVTFESLGSTAGATRSMHRAPRAKHKVQCRCQGQSDNPVLDSWQVPRAARPYNMDFKVRQRGLISASFDGDFFEPWDSAEPKDHEAADRRMELYIGWFANAIMLTQDYLADMRAQLGDLLSTCTEAEFALLREAELSGIDWLRAAPLCFRKHLVRIYNKYRRPSYITENGCPCPAEEKMSRRRVSLAEGTLDGAKVAGYFNWSLMDNFEGSSGYSVRFGLTFIDYDTPERTPKESAQRIRRVIKDRIEANRLP
ncbi:glycoside hydrolase superfamily [Aspergillus undulatus]|uniref:glycoside hydrolase superfamily n=1 Tax=Aspergillus undulatus TaxID=1810928 RepID=UPI003CCE1C96